jgi:MFS family permease
LLYSLYAFPNVVVPLIGGMLIDSKGPRIALILTATFCVIGQAIFGLGGLKNVWGVMLAGRVVFGLGG